MDSLAHAPHSSAASKELSIAAFAAKMKAGENSEQAKAFEAGGTLGPGIYSWGRRSNHGLTDAALQKLRIQDMYGETVRGLLLICKGELAVIKHDIHKIQWFPPCTDMQRCIANAGPGCVPEAPFSKTVVDFST